MIDTPPDVPVDSGACPMGFMVVAAFASALVWLCALLNHFTF